MAKLKIVADDKIPFLRGVLEPYADVLYLPGGQIAPEHVKDADALITRTRTKCDAKLLEHSFVRFIATATIGFDHLDTAYLDAAGINWTNAPGCNAASVAQYIGGALTLDNADLRGKTLGVVGVGNVGSKVVALGELLGMRVLRNDPPRARREGSKHFVEIPELLAESDYVTMHTPLIRDGEFPTFHLCDAHFLERMKPGAWLFNSGRGEVADGEALKKASRLGGIVLDVWENEPALDLELLARTRIGTPHIAGYSTDGKANGTAMSVQALAKFFDLPELADWRPAELPAPAEQSVIELDPALPEAGQIGIALRHAYDIRFDDKNLREHPEAFEAQRGNYRIRREPPAFTVSGGEVKVRERLGSLGFRTL